METPTMADCVEAGERDVLLISKTILIWGSKGGLLSTCWTIGS